MNREPSPSDSPIEQEANVFASRLLAPACVLWGIGIDNAEDIASLCNISITAAEIRQQRLKELRKRDKELFETVGHGCFLISRLEQLVFEQFMEYIHKNKR